MRLRAPAAVIVLCLCLVAGSCGGSASGRLPNASAKIGFVFVGTRDDLGYNQAAWEGSDAVIRAFPDLTVLRAEGVPETAEGEKVMEGMVKRGVRILFATSFGHRDAALAVARRHPEVIVVHEGGLEPARRLDNFGTYFGTVYEPVYQAGIAAGAATRTGKLGFVAAFPIPAVFNNVNAFTLGARSVNPTAITSVRFTLDWCDPARQGAAAAALLAEGADVLTQHEDCTATVLQAAEQAGVRSVGYHYDGSEVAPTGWLIGSVWDWRALVTDIVRTALTGSFARSRYNGDFRGSLRTGDNPFVLTEPGPTVAAAARQSIEAAGARFRAGESPFDGPLSDRDGRLRIAAARPTQSEIDSMDWFVPGVMGEVPSGRTR
jgi:simple sugar transport system substrate-binding protein/basic membrane protein A